MSNINLLMKNPEEYIHNSLNSSVSKYAHAFPKADRFDKSKRLYHYLYAVLLRWNTLFRQCPTSAPAVLAMATNPVLFSIDAHLRQDRTNTAACSASRGRKLIRQHLDSAEIPFSLARTSQKPRRRPFKCPPPANTISNCQGRESEEP